MAVLELKNVSKVFGSGTSQTEVLRSIDLSLEEGEFVAIVGFSGSGKSTLMNLLAGLLKPDRGEVRFKGQLNPEPGPERGLVFQNYSLLPWLTVYENIRLAVDQVMRDRSEEERDQHVKKYVEMVNLTPATAKKPGELSGGMRQRVSLARTLSLCPDVLLLDEPLGALDALTRAVLQDEIARIWQQDRTTVLLITNDVDEALLLADRIVPLKPGPGATLGKEFEVDLARPRNRAALNHDASFKEIRNAVVGYLNTVRDESREIRKATRAKPSVTLPKLDPIDLRVS
ncbi:MAG TPA: ABC transporter ATP-binding protein [Polyangiaceae bacterium]|nr:ABC transporter ATP-binding protein [Polyangiaceae bacterium]